ncbi:hypothetical protein [Meiothermus sp. Pnk-1]|nr:hypothetical protein [Meiothermus sp. Pnk-1]
MEISLKTLKILAASAAGLIFLVCIALRTLDPLGLGILLLLAAWVAEVME